MKFDQKKSLNVLALCAMCVCVCVCARMRQVKNAFLCASRKVRVYVSALRDLCVCM